MVRVRLVGDGPMVEFRLPLGDNREDHGGYFGLFS
jgi:hypothetical protein